MTIKEEPSSSDRTTQTYASAFDTIEYKHDPAALDGPERDSDDSQPSDSGTHERITPVSVSVSSSSSEAPNSTSDAISHNDHTESVPSVTDDNVSLPRVNYNDEIRIFRRNELARVYRSLAHKSSNEVYAWSSSARVHMGNLARQVRDAYYSPHTARQWFACQEVLEAFPPARRARAMSRRVLLHGIRLVDGTILRRADDDPSPVRDPFTAETNYFRRRRNRRNQRGH